MGDGVAKQVCGCFFNRRTISPSAPVVFLPLYFYKSETGQEGAQREQCASQVIIAQIIKKHIYLLKWCAIICIIKSRLSFESVLLKDERLL